MEISLIKKLESNNQKYGYNFLSGGQYMSDKDKEKISEAHKGKNKGKSNHNSVPIICLNDLTIFNSIADANEWLGYNRKYRFLTTILHSNNEIKIMGTHPVTGERCAWDFYDPNKTYEIINNPQIPPHTNSNMVICIETKEVFNNVVGASKHFGLSRQLIGQCCTGKLKKCGMSIYPEGYHFKYYEDYLKENNVTNEEARDSLFFVE